MPPREGGSGASDGQEQAGDHGEEEKEKRRKRGIACGGGNGTKNRQQIRACRERKAGSEKGYSGEARERGGRGEEGTSDGEPMNGDERVDLNERGKWCGEVMVADRKREKSAKGASRVGRPANERQGCEQGGEAVKQEEKMKKALMGRMRNNQDAKSVEPGVLGEGAGGAGPKKARFGHMKKKNVECTQKTEHTSRHAGKRIALSTDRCGTHVGLSHQRRRDPCACNVGQRGGGIFC